MEQRYLIRIRKLKDYGPKDSADLTRSVRNIVEPYEASVGNLRVSSQAVEFDLLLKGKDENRSIVRAISDKLGPIITEKRLDQLGPKSNPVDIVQEAKKLVNEERYWECHEVLEQIWREAKGDERDLLQGVILACAALVHAQRDENYVALYMIDLALDKLGTKHGTYLSLNIASLRAKLEQMRLGGRIVPFAI